MTNLKAHRIPTMTNREELIAQLRHTLSALIGLPEVGVSINDCHVKTVQSAIETLSTPLPDDVAEMIGKMQTAAEVLPEGQYWAEGEWCGEAADMLERLWRENERLYVALRPSIDAEQRIESLQAQVRGGCRNE